MSLDNVAENTSPNVRKKFAQDQKFFFKNRTNAPKKTSRSVFFWKDSLLFWQTVYTLRQEYQTSPSKAESISKNKKFLEELFWVKFSSGSKEYLLRNLTKFLTKIRNFLAIFPLISRESFGKTFIGSFVWTCRLQFALPVYIFWLNVRSFSINVPSFLIKIQKRLQKETFPKMLICPREKSFE